MKKLLAIIGVLLIIFIVMLIYRNNLSQNNVNVSDVQEIETYIYKIYMWKEITEDALPKFDNINNAPDLWVWEVIKKNLEEFDVTYNQIEEKSKEIFGNKLKKQFPKEGYEFLQYDENTGKYITTGMGLDMQEDLFLIKEIKKYNNKYEVEIIEYLEDYENALDVEDIYEEYDIYIRNLNQEIISTIKSTESETKKIEIVKENIDKFTTKVICLKIGFDGNLYIESVK